MDPAFSRINRASLSRVINLVNKPSDDWRRAGLGVVADIQSTSLGNDNMDGSRCLNRRQLSE